MTSRAASIAARRLLTAGLVLLLPLSALADRGLPRGACDGLRGHPPVAEMLPPYLRGIALTDGQHDLLFELLHAQAPAMRERANAVRKAEGELQTLAFAADFSEARARTAVDAAGRAQGELAAARLRVDRQVAELLSPEQRRQLQARRSPREACEHGGSPRHGAGRLG